MIDTIKCFAGIQKATIHCGAVRYIVRDDILHQTSAEIGRVTFLESKLKIGGHKGFLINNKNTPFK